MISRKQDCAVLHRLVSAEASGELVGGVWPRRVWVAGWLAFAAFFVLKAVPGSPLRAAASRPAEVARQECAQPDSHPRAPDGTWTIGGYRVTTKNIEDVTDRDLVLAKDPDTGELAAKPVVQTFRRTSDHLRILRIRNADSTEQTIETTNEHPFWVPGHGWVKAGDLAIGDTVTHTDGLAAELVASTHEPHPEGVSVYNFEVADLHNYFVSASPRAPPVLVHNTCILFGQRSVASTFAHGEFAGRSIASVAADLRAGIMTADRLPIEFVVRNGQRVALNNRSLLALRRAGVQPTVLIDHSGIPFFEGLLNRHLGGGMPSDVIRVRGGPPGTSFIW
jgi:hypothetical protein